MRLFNASRRTGLDGCASDEFRLPADAIGAVRRGAAATDGMAVASFAIRNEGRSYSSPSTGLCCEGVPGQKGPAPGLIGRLSNSLRNAL